MPVFLLHGFRWPRPLIRIHIILQNIDEAAAEWLVAPGSSAAMLDNFRDLFPDSMSHLPALRFVEQHDVNDSNSAGQPFAYVADIWEEVDLSVDVDEVRARGIGNEQWAAMMELRDKLAPEEKVGWYVVVCGDETREPPAALDMSTEGQLCGNQNQDDFYGLKHSPERKQNSSRETQPRGLKKLLGMGGRRKSRAGGETSTNPSTLTVHKTQSQSASASQPTQLPSAANGRTASSSTQVSPEPSFTPSAPGPRSVNGSISPIDPSFTPDTDLSISPKRRYSITASVASRGVSPMSVRRPLGPFDRIGDPSPATRTGYVQTRYPVQLHDATTQQQARIKRLSYSQQHSLPVEMRTSIAALPPTTQPRKSVVNGDRKIVEVITMNPSSSSAAAHGFRRSRNSAALSSRRSLSPIGLDSDSVSEVTNPQVYIPTHGNGLYNSTKSASTTNLEKLPQRYTSQRRHRSQTQRQYFGSDVNQFDLIANNIENAFQAMR